MLVTETIHKSIYEAVPAQPPLSDCIEWFWEGNYIDKKPDRSLPNICCSLVFNLGPPLILHTLTKTIPITADVVWPRQETCDDYNPVEHIFGIKFKFSLLPFISGAPQSFFSNRMEPMLNYVDPDYSMRIHKAGCFEERVAISETYFQQVYEKNYKLIQRHKVLIEINDHLNGQNFNDFNVTETARNNFLASKTLERYFLRFIGLTPKQAFCIIRSRHALHEYHNNYSGFDVNKFGYFDHSHFYKEVIKVTGLKLNKLPDDIRI